MTTTESRPGIAALPLGQLEQRRPLSAEIRSLTAGQPRRRGARA
ncbi:hypothetical protein [Actinoplanes teichomyceticus]|uniref:Uncharacterized protein n=1 Tax=Actinoplanes teichomyceticus TaxID=1867 RepID=A0A561VC67_ACTTI|nr:hypothetical protein [Actinoplanes teichomyceticus]TWG09206.1 hypothetical protein FHX34_1095 [Actinoplanes teichomyceticus]